MKSKGPYALIIDENGYIRIFGDRFKEATDDDLFGNINKMKDFMIDNPNLWFEMNNYDYNLNLNVNMTGDEMLNKYNEGIEKSKKEKEIINKENSFLYVKNDDIVSRIK